jgi:hypothetical protein
MATQHSPPPAEMTLFGRAERFCTKQIAALRGNVGSRLDLSIQDLPSMEERVRLSLVLDALEEVKNLSPLPRAIQTLLKEVHAALLATDLSERHAAFSRASKLLVDCEPLRIAVKAPFNPPDEVTDFDDAVKLCRLELNLAVQRVSDAIRWAHPSMRLRTQLVAHELSTARGWILQAGRVL